MKTVRDILDVKGRVYWSVKPNTSVYDALQLMSEKEIGALLVMDEEERLVGIVSERDYARKIALQGKSSQSTSVSDIMTPDVVAVAPLRPIEECMAVMTEGRFRHAPVVDEGKVVGVISLGDLVKAVIDDQRYTISQLEHYITDTR